VTEHKNIAAALVAALADLSVVDKGRTAEVGKYKYDYADLGDTVKLTRPVLAKHGLVVLTPIHDHGDDLACTVVVLHTSGERLDFGPLSFPHGETAQATGSWVTYMRRYALLAALGMAAGDDDDGASAAPRKAQGRKAPPKASHDTHEMIRQTIAVLNDDERSEFVAWWKSNGLPSISKGDTLSDQQAEMVLAHIDTIPAKDAA
jgi:hypothetical protein